MKPEDPELRSHISGLLSRPELRPHIRVYSWLSASVALYQNDLTHFFIELALDEQIPVLKVKEIILQNYLFCGFPNAIEGLIVLNRALLDRGVKDDNFKDARDAHTVIQDGLNLCRKVYGKNYEKLMRNMEHVSSDISDWMVVEGYGKVLSRPILTPLERELSVIAALAVLQRERQLISHIRGAAHVGATYDEINEIIFGLAIMTTQEAVDAARGLLDKTLK